MTDLYRQIVGKVQLAPEEADIHRADPVYLDLDSGFYMFPVRVHIRLACCSRSAPLTLTLAQRAKHHKMRCSWGRLHPPVHPKLNLHAHLPYAFIPDRSEGLQTRAV